MKDPKDIFTNIESQEVERLKREVKKLTFQNDEYFTSRQVSRIHNKKLEDENAILKVENNDLKQKNKKLETRIDPQTMAVIQKDDVVKAIRKELDALRATNKSLRKQLTEAAERIVKLSNNAV
jgi:predicted RNase H-like nuclease (RuvC/YqgF family)